MSEDIAWFSQAACAGMTHLFFGTHVCNELCPPLSSRIKTCPNLDGRKSDNLARDKLARRVCRSCPVLEDCKAWITKSPNECKYGVVAGWSESERRRINWSSTKKRANRAKNQQT